MPGSPTFTWRQRLRYRLDNVFARGPVPVLLLLAALMAVVFLVAGVVQAVFDAGPDDQPVSVWEGFWLSFVRSLDPGTFGGDQGRNFRIVGLIITLLGILAMAAIIGVVSSGIDRRLELLKEGRSLVVESDHSLILGDSIKVSAIVSELVIANESRRDAAIVILSPSPATDLERLIRDQVPDLKTSRLVLRTGDPTNIHDLALVNPAGARSIIILSSDDAEGDSATVKAAMAVLRLTAGRPIPTVAEVQSRSVGEALRVATGGRVIVVISSDIVGRVSAQVTRRAGLSAVYQELLDFSGDEVYMAPADGLAGHRYGDALLAYASSTVIGVKADSGEVTLNPAMDRVITPGEELVVIAEDDSTIGVAALSQPWDGRWSPRSSTEDSEVEQTLIIGWSHYVSIIAHEIDGDVSAGSRLDIVVDPELVRDPDLSDFRLSNQSVRVLPIGSLDLSALEPVVRDGDYHHILIVCYRDELEPGVADARALLTLMAVRQWIGERECNVVTELLLVEDTALAEVARPDDFVVSERLMSLALAQISENPALANVFRDLLDSFSVAVRMRRWDECGVGAEDDFGSVVAAMRGRGESAIGWRCALLSGHERDLGGGIFINPPKSMAARFSGDDQVIVIG